MLYLLIEGKYGLHQANGQRSVPLKMSQMPALWVSLSPENTLIPL